MVETKMVTNTEGYIQIIEYLTEHLSLFENSASIDSTGNSVLEIIEQEMSEQIMAICHQNGNLSFEQRNIIIQEIDVIVHDLEEILSGVVDKSVTEEQAIFINEFAILIKNLFDTEINQQAML